MHALPDTRAADCHCSIHPEPDLQLPDQGWTRLDHRQHGSAAACKSAAGISQHPLGHLELQAAQAALLEYKLPRRAVTVVNILSF